MIDDPLIARLAAANPVAAPPPVAAMPRRSPARRRLLAAALAAVAIAIPAAAFADSLGGLLGFSTEGRPVATASTPFAQDTGLAAALRDLDAPSTMQLLAERDGIAFYAGRRDDGVLCLVVDSGAGRGVGCDLGSPGGVRFPSPERPIFDFSRFGGGSRLAGFAADGVARVELVDAAGATLASAAVADNVYAEADVPAGAAGVEALDANGAVVYRRSFDEAP